MHFLSILFLCAACHAASLMWDANSETNVGGYRVHYGTNARAYVQTVDVGTNTQWRITNGTHFAVTAYDTDGLESDYSDEVSLNPVAVTQRRSHVRKIHVGRIRTR